MSTRNALSPNWVDVNNAINGGGPFAGPANDDDIVQIPAGPATWDKQLVISKAITVIGLGNGPVITSSNAAGLDKKPFWVINRSTGGAKKTRITNIEFQNGTFAGSGSINNGGYIRVVGSTLNGSNTIAAGWKFRMDHCKFVGIVGYVVFTESTIGVVDHNLMDNCDQFGYTYCKYWDGYDWGDGSWAAATQYGSLNCIVYEDNAMRQRTGVTNVFFDGTRGARVVIRHNTLIQPAGTHGSIISHHGNEGRARSVRHMEVYDNLIVSAQQERFINQRGGTMVAFNNIITGGNGGTVMDLTLDRAYTNDKDDWEPFDNANGRSPWDVNYPNGGSNSNPTHYYYGTAGSGSGVQKIVVPGAGWTPSNKWVGYSIQVVDASGNPLSGFGHGATILSSTSDTLNLTDNAGGFGSGPINVSSGQKFKIHRVEHAMDMCGRAVGGRVSGGSKKTGNNPVVMPAGWNNQVTEPCYEWNNHKKTSGPITNWATPGSQVNLDWRAVVAIHQEGVHYYNDTLMTVANGASVDYPWDAGATARVGAADGPWSSPNIPLPQNVAGGDYDGPGGYNGVYPHPLVSGAVVTQQITTLDHASFVEGTGGTFQVQSSGFSAGPTYSKSGSFPASGSTFSSGGLLTVGAGSAAGIYNFTITATNGGENASQPFVLTITAAPTKVIGISGSLAFGDRDINTTAQLSFTIANTGNSILTVTNITLPSGFTANWTSGTIGPGATHLVAVTFAPVAGASYGGTVTVVSDKTSGTNTLAASGVGVTRIMGLSGDLAFGSITTGQTATRQLTISNTGNRALAVTALSYPEGFSGDFNSGSIAAGGNQVVNVTFAPTAVQSYGGSVDIVSNKTSGVSTFAASGAGTASATKIIQLTGDLAFGNVQTGTSVIRVLTLTNSGNSSLAVSAITLPTGFSADWTSGTINAGATQNVNVTFSPVAATTYSGTVTVTSNATGGINTTSASGTGVAPATRVIALSGNLGFGSVLVGTSTTRTLTIANTGSAPLVVSSITYPTGFTGAFSGTIAPGASQNVTVTFAPTAPQSYNGTISVASDATSGTNTIAVTGSGVTPTTRIIGVSGDLAFGNVQKHHSAQRIMTIANTGTAALTVSNITCPTAFSVNWSSGSIAPGGSRDVTVTFAPNSAGTYGGTITVVSNKTNGVNTIQCSGTGTNKKQVPFFILVG